MDNKISFAKFGSPWQPEIGQRVQVVGKCSSSGQHGKVVRSRGLGIFTVILDNGKTINSPSRQLKSVSV